MRLVWDNGNGGANIEWFSVLADGTKVLINDTNKATAFKAYRAAVTVVQPKFNAPTIAAGNVTISWTGTGTLTLEQTDSLSPPNWQPAPSQANPQTPPATTGTKFYRIKQTP